MTVVELSYAPAPLAGATTAPVRTARWPARAVAALRQVAPAAVPLAVLSVIGWAGTAASPMLLGNANLVLIALSPRWPFLLAAASTEPLWAFLAVGTLRLGAGDPFNYRLGRTVGPGACELVSSRVRCLRRPLAWLNRLVDRFGLLAVFVRPTQPALLMAGARRLPPLRVAAADLAGTVAQLLVVAFAADVAASPARRLGAACAPVASGLWSACATWPGLAVSGALVTAAGLWLARTRGSGG